MRKNGYVLINGYFATGASAVVDYLKEFENIYTPETEFRLLKEPHGIIDLDYVLNGHFDVLNEDIAIRDFIKFTNQYLPSRKGFKPFGLGYERFYGKEIIDATKEYIKKIVDCEYEGFWWYLDMLDSYPIYIFHKIMRKLKIYDDRVHRKMYFRCRNEEDFLKSTRDYLEQIFEKIYLENPEVDYIVLEQAIPANQPALGQRYFPGCKVLNVERDPRSVFVESLVVWSNLGQIGPYAVKIGNVKLFVDYYKKLRDNSKNQGECLKVQFEDFVLNKSKREEVLTYLGIDEKTHVKPETTFIPSQSEKNVFIWKKYDFKEEYKVIERELSEYLYE